MKKLKNLRLIQNDKGEFITVECEDTFEDETPEEPADWLHPYQKRIVVNPEILFNEEARGEILGIFALVSIRGLPQEETEEGIIHIYVNEIKPAEAYMIEKYKEFITVEDRDE